MQVVGGDILMNLGYVRESGTASGRDRWSARVTEQRVQSRTPYKVGDDGLGLGAEGPTRVD